MILVRKKKVNGKNERTGKKDEVVKNETLKGNYSNRKRTNRTKKRLKEHPGYPVRDRSYPSNS